MSRPTAVVAVRPAEPADGDGDLGDVVEVGRVEVDATDQRVVSIDASHPDYVVFSTRKAADGSGRLYRWRKPPPP